METKKVLYGLGFYVGFGATAALVLYRPFELMLTAALSIGSLCLALYCIFKYMKG